MIDKNDPRLTAFILGELNESDIREIQKAVAADPELQSVVDEIRETVGQLNSAYRSESEVALDDDRKAALNDMIDETGRVQDTSVSIAERRFYRESLFYWTLAIAASLLLLLIPLGVFDGVFDKGSSRENVAHIDPSVKDRGDGDTASIDPRKVDISGFSKKLIDGKAFTLDGSTTTQESSDNLLTDFARTDHSSKDGAKYAIGESLPAANLGGIELDLNEDSFYGSNPAYGGFEADAGGGGGGIGLDAEGRRGGENYLQPEFSDEPHTTDDSGKRQIVGDFAVNPRVILPAETPRPTIEFQTGESQVEQSQEVVQGQANEEMELLRFRFDEDLENNLDANVQGVTSSLGLILESNEMQPARENEMLDVGKQRYRNRAEANANLSDQLLLNEAISSHDRQPEDPSAEKNQDRGIAAEYSRQPSPELRNELSGALERRQSVLDPPSTPVADATESSRYYFYGREREGAQVLIPKLLERVNPSGTGEIMIRQLGGVASIFIEGDETKVGDVDAIIEQIVVEGQLDFEGRQVSEQLKIELGVELAKHNNEVRRKKAATTWKRVQAIPNTSRLMVGDKDELEMNGMQVNVQVDGFRARVLIDCFYYNHHPRQLEGTFKLRLPDDASLYYFAFGQSAYEFRPDGKLAAEEFLPAGQQFVSLQPAEISRIRQNDWQHVKEARVVTREKAAHAYSETVRRRVDPALVEWSGAGVFNARVFPLMPNKLHRIVIGYDVNLTQVDGKLVYDLDLPESTGECKVNLNVLEMDGVEYKITPDIAPVENLARVERLNQDKVDEIRRLSEQRQQLLTRLGKQHPQVLEIDAQIDAVSDARNNALAAAGENRQLESRYHFDNPNAKSIRLELTNAELTMLRSDDAGEGSFWATQISPELPRSAAAANDRAVFLVDTSLSSQPDKFNVWLKLLQATLNNNRDSLKKFSVLFFNVESHFWRDGYIDNTQENVTQLIDHCQQLALEGATDVYGAIERAASADWIKQDDKSPALFLLSDGAANWGETNLRLLNRLVADSKFGNLFAYQTGLNGTAISNLRVIADECGGAVFSVTSETEIQQASTAHRQRPWRVANITVEGATDVMTAGRVQWIYPGQSVMLVGRTELDGVVPVQLGKVVLHLEQGDEKQAIEIESKRTVETDLASRLYGHVAVGQLESLGESLFDVAAAYARHFRITGQTCSLLMLDSEADYQRFDIKPEEDLFVIKSKDADRLIEKTLKDKAAELADPKQLLLTWLTRLESQPGLQFKMPTALKLALNDMQVVAISTPLDGSPNLRESLPDEYLQMLLQDQLDYQIIKKEADRRLLNREDQAGSATDEALKVMSSLVEMNPGDLVLARDVAFSAMELQRPAQAYHLLRRVALARPYESSIYLALGQCLTQLKQADMAIVFYEIAVNSSFQNRSNDYTKIAASEYSQLLRQVVSGKQESSVKDFAKARLVSLTEKLELAPCDLVVTMMWNTDQTDIDLHIVEPSGEECFYQHKDTRSGGHLTHDITDGFGPEMYTLPDAPKGEYKLLVKYYAGNQNRTDLRSKVYLTIHRNFGRDDATVSHKTVQLSEVGGKEPVDSVSVK